MDILFDYLETKYLQDKYEGSKLEFRKSASQLIITNSFYWFKLKKVGDKYVMSHFWKKGILILIFRKQSLEMTKILNDIKEFAKYNNLIIEELFYNSVNK